MQYIDHKHFVYKVLFFVFFSNIHSQPYNQDLQQMKAEYDKFQRGQSIIEMQTDIDEDIDNRTGLPAKAQFAPYQFQLVSEDTVDIISKYFGYDFFSSREIVTFWENLPTPANYFLGPGDELIISLWGETQLRQTYTISRDGKIYDEKVGLLSLMGKTIEKGEIYLTNQFSRVYATLKGNNPTTYIDISLGKLRSINVNFVGEINYPGVYPVHPFSTVITGLIQAGGIDTTGSLRNIQIKREGEIYLTIDLYDYLLKGNLPENIQLRDQDIVVVPVRQYTVTVDSAVVRPGIYESKPGETVKQMISYAGGLKPDASSSIGIKRIIPIGKRQTSISHIENYYIDYKNSQLTTTQNGDLITVRRIFKTVNEVKIIGQVKNPGTYHYSQGMTLKHLFELGGGFSDSTFWKSVYQNRGELVRRDPETRYESVIEIDLNDIMNDERTGSIKLQNLDRFVIHANLNFFEKKNVQILGEVNIPGSYPLISDNETLKSLLSRAGNLTSKALNNGISIYRDKKYFEVTTAKNTVLIDVKDFNDANGANDSKVKVAWQNESITLMPGDSVIVKESTGTINISGEVYNPGLIEYRKGKSLRYYVNAAGGVTELGNKKNIIVVHANGFVSPKKWYSTPKVNDGATIIVNQKEPEDPFDATQFATNWTSIISSLITAVILSKQL